MLEFEFNYLFNNYFSFFLIIFSIDMSLELEDIVDTFYKFPSWQYEVLHNFLDNKTFKQRQVYEDGYFRVKKIINNNLRTMTKVLLARVDDGIHILVKDIDCGSPVHSLRRPLKSFEKQSRSKRHIITDPSEMLEKFVNMRMKLSSILDDTAVQLFLYFKK